MFTENISYMPQGISEINTNTNEVEQTEVMDFEGNYEIDDFGVSLGVVNSTQESQSNVDENLDKETESEEIKENDKDSQDNKIDINLSQQPIEKDVEMAVDEDIKIEFTGLRPGEKLYEELLMNEEGLKDTANKLIHIGKPIEFDEQELFKTLEVMKNNMYNDSADIRLLVHKIVPTYHYSYESDKVKSQA